MDAYLPTEARPGSSEKLNVMRRRAEEELPVCIPGDAGTPCDPLQKQSVPLGFKGKVEFGFDGPGYREYYTSDLGEV